MNSQYISAGHLAFDYWQSENNIALTEANKQILGLYLTLLITPRGSEWILGRI